MRHGPGGLSIFLKLTLEGRYMPYLIILIAIPILIGFFFGPLWGIFSLLLAWFLLAGQ